MSERVKILQINNVGDGDGRKWPKHTLIRNDAYFQEKVAEMWIKDHPEGPAQPGVTYRLSRLPNGYAGFEKARPDSKHVDRYIYGHSNGQFRSLTEFYPHFKFLMDYGNAFGCECKLCTGSGSRSKPKAPETTSSEARPARTARTLARYPGPTPAFRSNHRSDSKGPRPLKRKLVDLENTPDIYELMIEKLKNDRNVEMDERVEERMSPDWRTSNSMSKSLLESWQLLPKYVPRVGEVVLFVRRLAGDDIIAWNQEEETFQRFNKAEHKWLECPKWEAGIVTQMPKEPVDEQDLVDDTLKEQSVIESGFRIEPISQIGSERKPLTKQYKYIPLRLIRPFTLWSECMTGIERSNWHPTITHGLTIASSFCCIGRYRFTGRWPNASVYCRGAYIGPELVMVGDTVALSPNAVLSPPAADSQDAVTDIMVVTAIRLRFVNLDVEETGLMTPPADGAYQTSLHIRGKVFTLDPTRSFDGVGKVPVDPKSNVLASGMSDYGPWYPVHDPNQPEARLEIPFTRILSRCQEASARRTWFRDVTTLSPESIKRAGSSTLANDDIVNISVGSEGIKQARKYSSAKDPRIRRNDGKTWFWADTRIEQLDLHEVNNSSVGVRETERTIGKVTELRTTLKAMDGKASAIVQHQAAKKQKEEQEVAKAQSSYGMVAASVQAIHTEAESPDGGGEEEEAREESMELGDIDDHDDHDQDESNDRIDAMDVDEPESAAQQTTGMMASTQITGAIELSSGSEDSDDAETNRRAAQLAMSMRTNNSRV